MSVENLKEETPRKQDYKTRRGSQENKVAARQGNKISDTWQQGNLHKYDQRGHGNPQNGMLYPG
jgi:hypothetical protein